MTFCKSLETFISDSKFHKYSVTRFLCKNFKENTHYTKVYPNIGKKKSGGNNKNDYMLTSDAYELLNI